MIFFYKQTMGSKGFRILSRFKKGCWVDVVNPDTVELEKLASTYDLDKDLLVEALD